MIREIDRIAFVLMPDGLYASVNNLSNRQKELLAEFGVYPEHFKDFVDDMNHRRLNPINSQVHQLPGYNKPDSKRRGRPPKKKLNDDIPPVSKRNLGRPKGSFFFSKLIFLILQNIGSKLDISRDFRKQTDGRRRISDQMGAL